jgi:hypothetical protein
VWSRCEPQIKSLGWGAAAPQIPRGSWGATAPQIGWSGRRELPRERKSVLNNSLRRFLGYPSKRAGPKGYEGYTHKSVDVGGSKRFLVSGKPIRKGGGLCPSPSLMVFPETGSRVDFPNRPIYAFILRLPSAQLHFTGTRRLGSVAARKKLFRDALLQRSIKYLVLGGAVRSGI